MTPPQEIYVNKRLTSGGGDAAVYTFRYEHRYHGNGTPEVNNSGSYNPAAPVVTVDRLHQDIQGMFEANGSQLVVVGDLTALREVITFSLLLLFILLLIYTMYVSYSVLNNEKSNYYILYMEIIYDIFLRILLSIKIFDSHRKATQMQSKYIYIIVYVN